MNFEGEMCQVYFLFNKFFKYFWDKFLKIEIFIWNLWEKKRNIKEKIAKKQ